MDTSKDYYESVMRDFKTYGRGRTLEQYCLFTRSQLMLLLTGAVIRTIKIN